jgi:hypothetical protein
MVQSRISYIQSCWTASCHVYSSSYNFDCGSWLIRIAMKTSDYPLLTFWILWPEKFLYCINLNFHYYYVFRGQCIFLLLVFQNSWDQIRSLYRKWTQVLVTGLSGRTDKTSGLKSKLCGQDALVWDVPALGIVLSDSQMGLDWTGSREGNISLVRLFIMRISGEEYIIVGRERNECVNNSTAAMREITDKYRENETNMALDQ